MKAPLLRLKIVLQFTLAANNLQIWRIDIMNRRNRAQLKRNMVNGVKPEASIRGMSWDNVMTKNVAGIAVATGERNENGQRVYRSFTRFEAKGTY